MGKTRSILLTTRSFKKTGDAATFFKEMLNRYDMGERVSAEDFADLSALLERHDDRDEKIGIGVAGFEVGLPPTDVPQFSKRCFWIVRNDGTKIDFSIGHCLAAKPSD